MNSNSTYIRQPKIEDEVVNQLHHLYEAANPKSVTGNKLSKALTELYNAAKEKFDVLWKRPDGSRIFQLLFRRGDEKLRNQLITDFEPILFDAAKTRYSYYIVKYMISNGNAEQTDRIFKILKGRYDILLSHKIGHIVVEAIYESRHIKSEQKSLIYLDFYGPQWKKQTTPISFEEICKQGKSIRNAAIKTLTDNLTHIIDKDLGYLKLTQKLLLILGQVEPSALGQFVIEFKKFCFSSDGTQAAIISIQNAKPNDIKTALKLIEKTPRKSVIPGAGIPIAAAPTNQSELEEEEEEEEAVEDFEQEGEDDQNQNDQPTKKKSNSSDEPELGETTASIAMDPFGWRALCCAISYNSDMDVMRDEIIPNLEDQWNNICNNKNAIQLLIRLISIQPSVFHDLSFQKETLNEELKNYILPKLADHSLQSLDVLGTMDEGRHLIAILMKNLVSDPIFRQFAESVFTKENIVDKVMHKLIKSCVNVIGKDAADLALETINEVGLEEVLKTPGAWVVKELISTGNYKKLASQAVNAIKKNNIEGPAIEWILNPSAEKIEKPKKKFSKKDETKKGKKK